MAIACKGSVVVGTRINPFFMLLVKTDNAGTSASDQFTIPTGPFVGSYNYDVDWGDGNTDTGLTTSATHTYASAGTYTIKISGVFPKIYFNNGGDAQKLLDIQNWGTILWQRMDRSFFGCRNMIITATDIPDFSALTNGTFDLMFYNCDSLNGNNLSNWNTSGFTSLSSALGFAGTGFTGLFNADLSNWDVSNVTSFSGMFALSDSFNNGGASGIGNWDVSSGTSFQSMFQQTPFNQDISNWQTTNATNMFRMFLGNTVFNQDISSWDVSGVISFGSMFDGASSFNQNLGAWNINSLTNAQQIFRNSAMSTANYTDTLVSWANQVFTNGGPFNVNMATQTGRTFDTSRSGGANFANAGAARTYLTTATPTGAGWTISSDTVI
jgi:surface protein